MAAGVGGQFLVRTALNSAGSGAISMGATYTQNLINGKSTAADDLASSFKSGAMWGGTASIAADIFKGGISAFSKFKADNAWNNFSLDQKIQMGVLEPSKMNHTIEKTAIGAANITSEIIGNRDSINELKTNMRSSQ